MIHQTNKRHFILTACAAILALTLLATGDALVNSRAMNGTPQMINSPGDLDPTFGNGGKVIDGFIRDSSDSISAVATQPDGKIVAAGTSDGDFAVARYNPDGSLDVAFGSGGKLTTDLGSQYDRGTAVALELNGRIVIAGTSSAGGFHFVVVRYNSLGILDSTFGEGGIVRTRIGVYADASSVAIQSDGKIVAAGRTHNSDYNNEDFAVVRYNPDGSLDPTFGGDGVVRTSIGSQDAAYSAVIQADGKIVAAGFTRIVCTPSGCDNDFALVRYNADGSLDTGFGNGGVALTGTARGVGLAYSLAIQTDGKLVAAGSTESSNGRRVLVRYNANGTLDGTFGSGGKVLTQVGSGTCYATSVSIRSDGKIAATGYAYVDEWTSGITVYNPDGSLDTSFSDDGMLTTRGPNSDVIFQPDGRILAAGSNNDLLLARYNGDGSLDPTFGADGIVTTNFAYTGFHPGTLKDATTQPDGKIIVVGSSGDYAVARYNSDGSADATFGNGTGKFTTGSSGGVLDIAVTTQTNGKIVVAGIAYYGDMWDIGLDVLRYNSDGSRDTTFGNAGGVNLSASAGLMFHGTCVLVQSDGKIIACGGERLYRLNPDGSRDTTFGTGGEVDLPGTSFGYASAIQADGKIVIAAPRWVSVGNYDFSVARFNPNGTPDTSFGSGGVASPPTGTTQSCSPFSLCTVYDLVIQTDGKIVVAGGNRLVRYNENGSLDAGFGSGGVATSPMGTIPPCEWSGSCVGNGLAIQADGKLVLTGNSSSDFAIVRHNPDGSLDTTFGVGGLTTVDFTNSSDTAYELALDPQGRAVVVGESSAAFAIARIMLRSGVSVSGRVTTPGGQALRNATVVMTNAQGVTRMATTSSFGIYLFEDVPAGSNYTLSVRSKRYRFSPRILNVNGTLTGVDLVGLE
jgi:uncharacterized delta-60 repeat protein